ncbi:hypothetical protein BDV97DRAFT_379420 [Delphinella strobiligena]|nr:hypothetical protein BDV97DRAFT_379420 [Delphinella strobiligena]
MQPTTHAQKLVVFCDGTWCGPETDTRTNIQILAEMTGITVSDGITEIHDEDRKLKAKYFDGIGLGSTFLAYLFNGSTANDISIMCVETYAWIAENFTNGAEIWMFGLSRGAYTVRCVAGMINNCGILKHPSEDLCKEVYNIYTSPYPEDRPWSEQSTMFRARASWSDETPVKFMGLLDTVGSIGIPTIDAGNGPTYPTLWDQVVPSVVDKVYHACSLHDRLSVFQPCLTKLSEKEQKQRKHPNITERWFPGCHYDIGRQRFKFLRQHAPGLEGLLSILPNMLSGTLKPNEVLSDLVLRWQLMSINIEYPEQTVIKDIASQIDALDESIKTVDKGIGSGDVYSKAIVYAPFGAILSLLPTPGFLTDTVKLFLAIRDRRIPNDKAHVYPYDEPYDGGWPSIGHLAGVTRKRYPSKTYRSFETWRAYFSPSMPSRKEINGSR